MFLVALNYLISLPVQDLSPEHSAEDIDHGHANGHLGKELIVSDVLLSKGLAVAANEVVGCRASKESNPNDVELSGLQGILGMQTERILCLFGGKISLDQF